MQACPNSKRQNNAGVKSQSRTGSRHRLDVTTDLHLEHLDIAAGAALILGPTQAIHVICPSTALPRGARCPSTRSIVHGCKEAKLLVFLRQYQHDLFSGVFQAELAVTYPTRARGTDPVPPALPVM